MARTDTESASLGFDRLDGLLAHSAPQSHILLPKQVRIHAVALSGTAEVQAHCRRWLSPEERARMERFRFDRDRVWYLLAHGALRHVLGQYLGLNPEALSIRESASGKPLLIGHDGEPLSLRFSLSHSHGNALIAVAAGFDVGVDLEEVRASVNCLELAERFFSPAESRTIRNEPETLRSPTFFRYWVAKEAALKGRGIGLRYPLDRCDVGFEPGADRALVRWSQGPMPEEPWMVRYLRLDAGWVGAVSARGMDWAIV